MTKQKNGDVIAAAQAAMLGLMPDELDALAEFAIRTAVEKRQADAYRRRDFLANAARLPSNAFNFRMLLDVVVNVTGLDKEALLCSSKSPPSVKARQILFWLCATYTKLSTPQIGARVSRDHTTVLHGIGRVQTAREICSIQAHANPVAWAVALWEAEWPAPFAPDGGRLPRRRPAQVRPCA